MVIEYIRYEIDSDDAATFESAYRLAAASLDAAPECVSYELSRGVEEPGRYVLRIQWTSVGDHERGFRSGPHFGAFFAAVRPYVADIAEMTHYQPTAVTSPMPS